MTTRRKSRAEESAEESQKRILDASEKLFSSKGFAATSIREIAQEAGVSEGLIYHHFKDKTDLLTGSIEKVFSSEEFMLSGSSKETLPDSIEEYLQNLFVVAGNSITSNTGLGSLVRIMLSSFGSLSKENRHRILATVHNLFWARHSKILKSLLATQKNKDLDPDYLIRMIHGSLMGFFLFQEVLGGSEILPMDKKKYGEHFVKVFSRATGAQEGRKSK